jgi:hypothetical protein
MKERDRIRLAKEMAEQEQKTNEEALKKQQEVQKKLQPVFDEQKQREEERAAMNQKILAEGGHRLLPSAEPGLAGPIVEQLTAYKAASDGVAMYTRAIEDSKRKQAEADDQLKDRLSLHETEKTQLSKLEAAHKSLASSVVKSEKEMEEQESSGKKRIDQEMFDADSDTFEAIKKQNKEKEDQARYQSELDIRLKHMRQDQEKSAIESYLPTVKELAQTPGWMGQDMGWQMQLNQPMDRNLKMAEFGSAARELQAREADLKQSLLVEGPDSTRAKEDLTRIKSLKTMLADAGLIKEDKSDKIADRISDLVEMASIKGHGLKVVPVMMD